MSTRFITAILTVAATITALAAVPAHAGDRDGAVRVIAGATVLYLTGRMIEDLARQGVIVDTRGNEDRRGHGSDWKKKKDRRHVLPGSCVRRVEMRHKTRQVMPRHCLKRNDVRVNRLPGRCEINWRGRNGLRTGYAVHCLKRNGYEIARRW
ncbi:hypothetical protein ACN2XU_00395 [Primorskyibacter sp. 2E107]|uniref:hypothetical protein n=1 Tax=Primorskyibacter sp. 2E107 TaxID=3403458 RepID=UPI003AF69E54